MRNFKRRSILFYLTCLALILLSSSQIFADTSVSGNITTDTIWTKANSPYIVTGNLGIEKDVTLTIEPGVQVLVDGYYYIGVKGKIIANGSENEPIVLTTKNSLSDDEYGWQGIQYITEVDGSNTWQGSLFNYVKISRAHRGISSNGGIGDSDPVITIRNSSFDAIGYEGISLWGLPCVIENNYFTNLSIGNNSPGYSYAIDARGPIIHRNIIENSRGSGIIGNINCSQCPNPVISENRLVNLGGVGIAGTDSIISNNLIINNNVGVHLDSDSVVFYNTVYNNNIGIITGFGIFFISNNNIFSNSEYALKISSATDIDASGNWWGSENQAEINNLIFDYYDDFTFGKVNYGSFLTAIDQTAPIPPPFNVQVNFINGAFNLSWDSIDISDLKGYKIYYGINPDYPFNGNGANQGNSPIDVGNITNFSIAGLPIADYYFTVTAYDNSADGVDDQIEGHESWYAAEVNVSLHSLIVTKTGDGNGTVTSSPIGIACENDCTELYAHGAPVTLTAIADAGSTFSGWSGCDLTSGDTCTVTMNDDKNITANFSQNCDRSLTININPPGSGTVTRTSDKATYCSEEQVTLTANPSTGYNFSSWSGVDSSNGTTAQVIMSSNKTITATFSQIPVVNYNLSLSKSGNGSVKVNDSIHTLPWAGQFPTGTNVQIEAVPDSGWGFTDWTGDYTGSANSTTINLNGNKNITANFSQSCDQSLTINISPANTGTVTKNPDKGNYCDNEQVLLTASPNEGYNFSSWEGVDSSNGLTANLTMNDNKTVEANFTQQEVNEPEINVAPGFRNFGNVKAGQNSAFQNITISNTGSGDLVLGALSITGEGAGAFSTLNDNCTGQTLGQSGNCTVDIVFTPATAGSFHANLIIPSNDTDEPSVNADLEGGSGADLTGNWLFITQTCKNTKKGIKCNIKSKLTIQNIGTKDAGSSVVKFYLSDNDVYDAGDIFLKKVSTGKVKVGKSTNKAFAYNFKIGTGATGKYLIAVLDADNKLAEAAEGNNSIAFGSIP